MAYDWLVETSARGRGGGARHFFASTVGTGLAPVRETEHISPKRVSYVPLHRIRTGASPVPTIDAKQATQKNDVHPAGRTVVEK